MEIAAQPSVWQLFTGADVLAGTIDIYQQKYRRESINTHIYGVQ